jgi:hypothetical protein
MSMPSRSSGVAGAFLLYLDRKNRNIRRDRHWTGDPCYVLVHHSFSHVKLYLSDDYSLSPIMSNRSCQFNFYTFKSIPVNPMLSSHILSQSKASFVHFKQTYYNCCSLSLFASLVAAGMFMQLVTELFSSCFNPRMREPARSDVHVYIYKQFIHVTYE